LAFYETVIIGAGCSGMFAALELMRSDYEGTVAILEKGNKLTERNSLVYGWAGSGAYSDGKLTISNKVGGLLEEYIDNYDEVEKKVIETYTSFLDEEVPVYDSNDLSKDQLDRIKECGFELTPCKYAHMGTDNCKIVSQKIYAELSNLGQSYLRVSNEVVQSNDSNLVLLEMLYGNISDATPARSTGEGVSLKLLADETPARLETPAYFYPNPFRVVDTSELGYRLSKNLDIEIRIFNIRAHEVFREVYVAGAQGGRGTGSTAYYNTIKFGTDKLGGLSAGMYFFVLLNNNKVLGKGKFALLP